MRPWARLRHDDLRKCWIMSCDVCGLREWWHKYWTAQRALKDHVLMHEESDPPEPLAGRPEDRI
jgi:hypothetical protein